jgi:hypothetical protein
LSCNDDNDDNDNDDAEEDVVVDEDVVDEDAIRIRIRIRTPPLFHNVLVLFLPGLLFE